jgi:hypothetical protein
MWRRGPRRTTAPTIGLGFVAPVAPLRRQRHLLTVDLATAQVTGSKPVGQDPDVMAYDHNARRLYVAAESGTVTVLDLRERRLMVVGSDLLANNAHVVAVDPASHHSYYPVPAGANGHPALLEREPVR